MKAKYQLIGSLFAGLLLATGCASADPSSEPAVSNDTMAASSTGGIRQVTPEEGENIQTDPPDDLVVLDVRTPEEYAEGHLEGAITVDFYDENFAEQLAKLDPNVPYLMYCKSGNRSGQTAMMMEELGFKDVADVDGGIVAWADAGNPVVNQ